MSLHDKIGRRLRARNRKRITRLGAELFEQRLLLAAQVFTVTLATDNGDNVNPTVNTLRWAIQQADIPANAGSTIDFDITTGTAPFVINLTTTALLPISEQTTIDGTSQPGYTTAPLIEINGSALASGSGLDLTANASTIKGLDIVHFAGAAAAGIDVESNSNALLANFLGVAPDGTTAGPNTQGLLIQGTGNTIGGVVAANANVIGFNTTTGVSITAANNLIAGNFVGTDSAASNLSNPVGISVSASGNTIGGTTTSAANVIGFNTTAGVSITAANNLFAGNFVGTDSAGDNLQNSTGLAISSSGNTIGGTSSGSANIIGFNTTAGVSITAANNLIAGNFVGTNSAGSNLSNPIGISLEAGANTIGGTAASAANIIGFNSTAGVSIGGGSATGNLVIGNLIGTNSNRGKSGNAVGVSISANNNTIGGLAGADANIIGFNTSSAIALAGTGNLVIGNFVGTDSIADKLTNALGISITNSSNTIGGTSASASNVIGYSNTSGISIGGTDNLVVGNLIGTDSSGDNLSNAFGISINGSGNTIGGTSLASGNVIGFNTSAGISIGGASATGNAVLGNTISRNGEGVSIDAPNNTIGATIGGTNGGSIGGSIGVVQSLGAGSNTIAGNTKNGILINSGIAGMPNTVVGNLLIGNAQNGVEVSGNLSAANIATIEYNFIGISNDSNNNSSVFDSNGPTGNRLSGVLLNQTDQSSTLSGTVAAVTVMGNVISANGLSGVTAESGVLNSGTSLGASISRNIIGLDKTGRFAVAPQASGTVIPLGNALDGVLIDNVVGVTVGAVVSVNGPPSTPVNLISGNLGRGIEVRGNLFSSVPMDSNVIEDNFIGTDIGGTLAVNFPVNGTSGQTYTLGNLSDGILLFVPANSTIQDNLISNNRAAGVHATTQSSGVATTGALSLEGNFIGTDVTGTETTQTITGVSPVPLGNGSDGIFIDSITSSVIVGGVISISDPFSNVISGNGADGIDLFDSRNVLITGNAIGVDANGTSIFGDPKLDFGNASNGILVNQSSKVTIGGSVTGTGNVISSNHASGIFVSGTNSDSTSGSTADDNDIVGNMIGVNRDGTKIVQNANVGIVLSNSSNNTIGGTLGASVAGTRNIISGNLLDGILLANTSTNNVIQGNLIGTDSSGTLGLGNTADGVLLLGGPAPGTPGGVTESGGPITNNMILDNVISGNAESGVEIFGAGSQTNTVARNYIGVGIDGTSLVFNSGNGVYLNNDGGSIGGSNVIGPGNLISGNKQSGVLIFGTQGDGGRDIVIGNFIGTDENGEVGRTPLGNGGNGVFIYGTKDNQIGGTVPNGVPSTLNLSSPTNSNLISGNAPAGVAIFTPASSALAEGNIVAGNLIGTDKAGTAPVANQSDGIDIFSSNNNTIGETGGINVISGNLGNGVLISQVSAVGSNNNTLAGNYIGTDASGTKVLANNENGVLVENASFNTIGATSASVVSGTNVPMTPSNVISGNGTYGVQFLGVSQDNVVEGDYIGVNAQGTGSLGTNLAGVFVNDLGTTPSNETIGGTAGAGNIITGGTNGNGVEILGPAVSGVSGGNVVQGNLVGIDKINDPISNSIGIFVLNSAGNTIGGSSDGARNVISANSFAGIELTGLYSTINMIEGNYIGTDIDGTQQPGMTTSLPLFLQFFGVFVATPSPSPALETGRINNEIANNVISGNTVGVDISGQSSGASGIGTVQGVPFGQNLLVKNKIGTDLTGLAPDSNLEYGVYIDNSASNTIGGGVGQGNLVSANGIDGVEIFGGATQSSSQRSNTQSVAAGNFIIGNQIGVDANNGHTFTHGTGTFPTPDGPPITLGEQLYGVVVIGSSFNTIGEAPLGSQIIGGNTLVGVYITRLDFHGNIFSIPTNNKIAFNRIIDNGQYGVFRFEAPDNPVGIRPERFANQFAGNPINIEDFNQIINGNTNLPNPKSRFAHPKKAKTVPIKRTPRPKVHVVVATHTPKPATATAARPPRVPALFHAGKKSIVVAHVPAHPHR